MRLLIFILSLLSSSLGFASPQTWKIEQGKLTYHVNFPFKKVEGVSTNIKGKAVCKDRCRVLVASPIKSFDSGDTNRDYRVLNLTNSADHPFVSCKLEIKKPTSDVKTTDIKLDFAGENKIYKDVKIEIKEVDQNHLKVHGVIPMKLTDFKIQPPSLLGISIDNAVPVDFELSWKK